MHPSLLRFSNDLATKPKASKHLWLENKYISSLQRKKISCLFQAIDCLISCQGNRRCSAQTGHSLSVVGRERLLDILYIIGCTLGKQRASLFKVPAFVRIQTQMWRRAEYSSKR